MDLTPRPTPQRDNLAQEITGGLAAVLTVDVDEPHTRSARAALMAALETAFVVAAEYVWFRRAPRRSAATRLMVEVAQLAVYVCEYRAHRTRDTKDRTTVFITENPGDLAWSREAADLLDKLDDQAERADEHAQIARMFRNLVAMGAVVSTTVGALGDR